MTDWCSQKYVKKACHYIDENFEKKITLSDMESIAGTTKFHLIRCFNSQIGMTPHQYLAARRINNVQVLIQKSVSILEAALESGFCDQSHLNRVFLRYLGVTPGQYKMIINEAKKCGNNKPIITMKNKSI